jgi:hypothetical protein
MSDKKYKMLCCNTFDWLAKTPPTDHKAIAKDFFLVMQQCAISPPQNDIIENCLKLEIAIKKGQNILWPGDPGYEEAKRQHEIKKKRNWRKYKFGRKENP